MCVGSRILWISHRQSARGACGGRGWRGQSSSDGLILRGGFRWMLVHKVEAVGSVVESGVYRMCGGASKYARGSLESVLSLIHI